MEVAVLGPLELRRDGTPVDLGNRKRRALLAALALSVGRPVAVDTIIDLLWEGEPPEGVTTTLQSYVSTLRRVLEPERPPRAPGRVLVTAVPGYALMLPPDAVDAVRFERAAQEQHRALHRLTASDRAATAASGRPDLDTVVAAESILAEVLLLWRGQPFPELGDADGAVAERSRLEQLRLLAEEDLARAALSLGRHAEVAARLEPLTLSHPMHEGLAALRAIALARCGRQADALALLRRARGVLVEELGIEPGAALRTVQEAILRQEEWMHWRPLVDRGVPAPSNPAGFSAQARSTDPGATGDTGDASAANGRHAPGRFADPTAPWPMFGRDAHLAALLAGLDEVSTGRPVLAAATGEPGIGKSRLVREVARRAAEMGFVVAVGRCSQDDGAPPLWPWSTALRGLGSDVAALARTGETGQFAAWERITTAVLRAAHRQPVLLVFEDLHWADAASLRVLRLLLESIEAEPIAVVLTWRSRPEPTGDLADVAEALARRHGRRVELGGLGAADVARIVREVAGTAPTAEQVAALLRRTEGNPFFVVEYARLARQRGNLDLLRSADDPPTAVHDVIARRVARLPERTRAALSVAAVIGRQFEAGTLAAAAGMGDDELLDVIEPAQAVGLLREDGVDRFSFAHALVRDTVYAGLSASRRARVHATVARLLQVRGGRETEEARHWLAAGPSHAAQAWRSAVRAAGVARDLHAHEEAAELLAAAADVLPDDPDAGAVDRYGVLMELVDAYRWAGMWGELTRTVERAVEVARAIGDPVRVAQAAISTTHGGLWQSAAYGRVNEPIVEALRASLAVLPPDDSPLRCRVLLGLANELYYGSAVEERSGLVQEALGMARRLGDDALLLDALLIAFLGVWRPATAAERLSYATEATTLARRLGQDQRFALAATQRAVVLAELGRPSEMFRWATIARGQAERLRLPYVLIVLANLEVPWHAMAGRFDRCDELVEQSRRLDRQLALRQSGDPTTGALISQAIWRPTDPSRTAAVVDISKGAFARPVTVASYLWRVGAGDRAREVYAREPVQLDVDDWTAMLVWCNAAEVALHLGDAALGRAVRERLEPYAGRSCSAGSSNAAGPVDAYLALAAVATGDRAAARDHCERALVLCEEWGIPLVAAWLQELRQQYWF